MNKEELIAEASQLRGLPVRGEESFGPALDVLLPDLARSTTFRPEAGARVKAHILDTLGARFAIENWLEMHPDLADQPVERPTFILGMPRAGTTLLLNLLRLDPQRRVYWHWEGNREIPPVEADHLHDDPRIARRVKEVEDMLAMGWLDHRHHVEAGDEPSECNYILGQDFKAYPWIAETLVPTYFDWLVNDADMVAGYRYHKRVLQVLQSRAPGRWTLKFPSHGMAIEAILQVYPDARIVVTHRDPRKPVGSVCSASEHWLSYNNHTIDRTELGRQSLKIIELSTHRVMAARAAHPDASFIDFHYRRFVADPVGEIEKLYRSLDEDLPKDVREKMQNAVAYYDQIRIQSGKHVYHLEDYGLSDDKIDSIFKEYVQKHGVEIENR